MCVCVYVYIWGLFPLQPIRYCALLFFYLDSDYIFLCIQVGIYQIYVCVCAHEGYLMYMCVCIGCICVYVFDVYVCMYLMYMCVCICVIAIWCICVYIFDVHVCVYMCICIWCICVYVFDVYVCTYLMHMYLLYMCECYLMHMYVYIWCICVYVFDVYVCIFMCVSTVSCLPRWNQPSNRCVCVYTLDVCASYISCTCLFCPCDQTISTNSSSTLYPRTPVLPCIHWYICLFCPWTESDSRLVDTG